MCCCYLQAVITNNAEEGDDCVCYSQETERWLHASTALLQNKVDRAITIITRGM